jgi:hypothetical protein
MGICPVTIELASHFLYNCAYVADDPRLFGKRVYWLLGEGVLCWSGLMLRDLSAKFTRMNEAEPKGSNPQSEDKTFCDLLRQIRGNEVIERSEA